MSALALFPCLGHASGEPLFVPSRLFEVGDYARAIASADFNADGHQDLVASGAVLLGNGDGTFQPVLSSPDGALAVAVADLNADGRPDTVMGYDGPPNLSVRLGNGDGSFGSRVDYLETAGLVSSVAIADLNSDQHPDLVAANWEQYAMSVLLGNGDGTFAAPVEYSVDLHRPVAVAVADLDGDGDPDLAAANSDGTLSVLIGNGDGSFYAYSDYFVGFGSSSVAIADLNADGRLDIVTGSYQVSVLLGNGDGTFVPTTSPGSNSGAVAIADLNADGRPDIVAAGGAVWSGNGDGTFAAATGNPVEGNEKRSLVIRDLNGDGQPDLAAIAGSCQVAVALNANGYLGYGNRFATGQGPNSVAIGDLDADGRLDLVTSNSIYLGRQSVSVLYGKGDGGFGPHTDYDVGLAGFSSPVALADLNSDGWLDVVIGNGTTGTVSVLLGTGAGQLGPSNEVNAGGYAIAIADLNADGRPDLVTVDQSSRVSVLLGVGDGTFGARSDYPAPFARSIAVGDLNADGHPDLASANANGASVFLGVGDGTFGLRTDLDQVLGSTLAIADLNDDGRQDLVTALGAHLGNGDGTFGTLYFESPACGSYLTGTDYLAVADLDGDGHPDLAIPNHSANTIMVRLGDGDGSFGMPTEYSAGLMPRDVAIGDLNTDGRQDLAIASSGADAVTVQLNIGPGASRAPVCDQAAASVAEAWPPDHALQPVEIIGVTDPDGDPVTIAATAVTQDEPVAAGGDDCPGAVIADGAAQVRRQRAGSGNGRVYQVSFTARDSSGAECSGAVQVCVPHDRGSKDAGTCVDDGKRYDATGACPATQHAPGRRPPA